MSEAPQFPLKVSWVAPDQSREMEHPAENPEQQSAPRSRKGLIFALVAVIAVAGGAGLFFGLKGKGHAKPHGDAHAKAEAHDDSHAKPHADAHAKAEEHGDSRAKQGFFGRYKEAYRSLQAKVDELARASEENARLRLENENLRLQLANNQFASRTETASRRTASVGQRLSEETWNEAGRKMDTIRYQIPAHLLPSQLYTLGVSYFQNGETEKAAKILTRLSGLDDEDTYRTSKHYLLAGVAWYRLDHLQLADAFFDQAMKAGDGKTELQYRAQARLWRALVAERTQRHEKAQEWLLELVDHHPRSREAAWVNSKEAKRARIPASSQDDDAHARGSAH